jgi:peptidoglycan/LPS O-acetylase OafA/YrhL
MTTQAIIGGATPAAAARPAPAIAERRIAALDGLRGLMTIFVLVSHYFAEIHGGFMTLAVGWLAVDVFFVLSGFLVGRLIIDKGDRANFLRVFFIRRVCRTFPIYFVTVIAAFLLIAPQAPAWNDMEKALPFWSYLTFTQNMLFASQTSTGAYWLSPTWTMAVEEQFYLLAPAVILLTPRRLLPWLLCGVATGAAGFRLYVHLAGWPPFYALSTLPARADSLALGLLAAVAFARGWGKGASANLAIRAAAPVLIFTALAIRLVEGQTGAVMQSLGFFLVTLGAAMFILALARNAPEAARFENRVLAFCGHNSFAIYLTHMPILWLAHGLVLGVKPTLTTAAGMAVTVAAIPVCIVVSRLLTRFVEEPATAFGRSFAWSEVRRA